LYKIIQNAQLSCSLVWVNHLKGLYSEEPPKTCFR